MPIARFPSLSHWGAFTALVEDGRLVGCEPFVHDRNPSPMLSAIPALVYGATRVARPAVRAGWLKQRDRERRGDDGFIEVSWDTALGLVDAELKRVRERHGAQAIFGGSYGWSSAGRLHHARTLVRRFLFAGGGCVDQLSNYSWGAAQFLLPHVIGTYAPVAGVATDWPSIVSHTRLMVAFGGLALKNGQITSGGAGEHSMPDWLRAAAQAGVEFVVVSPYRGDAPAFLKARWVPIRPNTDCALMLAMAHTLVSENRCDRAFLERYCTGFDRFERYLLGRDDGTPKDARWAAAITGVDAGFIVELARKAAGVRTMLTCAWSLQRAQRGEQPYWAAIALAAMLGQVGLPGGGFAFGHGSTNGIGNPRPPLPGPEMQMGSNPAKRAIPVARIADMLADPGAQYEFNGKRDTYPDVRLVYWAGGNPFHHHQDLNRLRAAWRKPETIVVHEQHWTATARQADIVLPATTMVERNDIGGSTRDRYVLAMHQAIAPVGQARNDFAIFAELAARGGFETGFTEGRDEAGWVRHIYATLRRGCLDQGVELAPFEAFWEQGYVELPRPSRDFVLFEAFRADPRANPLATPSGKIELFSETVAGFGYDDCPGHPTWLPPAEWLGAEAVRDYPLHLISVQPPDRLHSQMDPGPVASAHKVAGREKLHIHPQDAAARGIRSGDLVRVHNARGACLAAAALDDNVRAGVLIMATGSWFDPAGDGASSLDLRGNPNVLTLDVGTSRLTQGPSAQSVLVEVERWKGQAPAVAAWAPPERVAQV